MRLVSIINAWEDTLCLLPKCIENHLQFCDAVIVIWSELSNFGYGSGRMLDWAMLEAHPEKNLFLYEFEPTLNLPALTNETRKRNYGIEQAKSKGFTHFMIADADEFYFPEEMIEEKKRFENPSLNGLVSALRVYIGKPTLWCEDHTLIPTIHKLQPNTFVGNFPEYPFAYDEQRRAHIDPSRRPNFLNGIEFSNTVCQHYSYVRDNMELKINNSSANLRKSKGVILDEVREARPGYLSKLYHRPLKECPNYFDI